MELYTSLQKIMCLNIPLRLRQMLFL